jgi:hypothetical protein
MRSITWRMTSTGHGAPPMMPVRSESSLVVLNAAWSSIAMNIVGTPYTDVHRSASMA